MNIKYKKISYIAEINLNSKSAYKHQVLKMCDEFSKKGFITTLYLINSNNIKFKTVKENHILKSNFKIVQVFKNIVNLNFFFRVIFAIKLFFILRNKKELLYSRSVLSGFIFSLLGLKCILEIHQPLYGFTKLFYKIFRNIILKKTKFIFINKNLNKHFLLKKNLFIIADDGVDLKDFNLKSKIKYKNSCVYTGSLFKGKGIELILKIAKKMKEFNFYVYGDISTTSDLIINECIKQKNLKLLGHVSYSQIPKILKSHKIILMPYSDKVFGNHKHANLSNYMSPLKLFDYLAAGRVIIASKNRSYLHILKNNNNSILCSSLKPDQWISSINKISSNSLNFKKFQKNSLKTAKLFTWQSRINKIVKFI